jgi:hypothetical protein
MATWTIQSFALVKKGGYLDKLAAIYPAPEPTPQEVSKSERIRIQLSLNQQDDNKLILTMLDFDRFPFNDPYIGFLRENPAEVYKNPKTVNRICTHLREMGFDDVLKGIEAPKQFNRQMGQLFNNWLHKTYTFTDDTNYFQKSKEPLIFLDASGEQLRQFANQQGCGLQKQPDFIANINSRYVIGEAKFIGTEGGNQNRAFDDALTLASRSYKNAITVAILDGIVWIPDSGQMSRRLNNFSANALSSLLIDDFFASI